MSVRRLIAAASLAVLALVDLAPHEHADGFLDLVADNLTSPAQLHITDCAQPLTKGGHFHRDSVREVHPCIACLRQHVPIAQTLAASGAAPITVADVPEVTLRDSHQQSHRSFAS